MEVVLETLNQRDPSTQQQRPKIAILEDATMEFPWGWIFFWNSAEFVRTKKPEVGLFGCAPCFVDSETGSLWSHGTGDSIDHQIRLYENTRRFGEPPVVVVEGCEEGTEKVAVIRLVREKCGLALKETTELVDRILANEVVEIPVERMEIAVQVTAGLEKLGVKVRQKAR